jgi:hypothetical protein
MLDIGGNIQAQAFEGRTVHDISEKEVNAERDLAKLLHPPMRPAEMGETRQNPLAVTRARGHATTAGPSLSDQCNHLVTTRPEGFMQISHNSMHRNPGAGR